MREISLNLKNMQNFRVNESYKQLRTNIEFSGEENKAIAITSCAPSEGKSSVSLSIASSLAEAGKKVLFIDADLRKSVLAGRNQIQGELKGLTHFLSGQGDLSEVLCKTTERGLFTIFAGPVPPNPAELLGGKKFSALLREARNVYDYIIIDTPPLGSVIDGAIVAAECDAAIMVVAANTVSYKFARSVKEQLAKTGCNLLGVVLNKVSAKKNKYYANYYGNYYGEED